MKAPGDPRRPDWLRAARPYLLLAPLIILLVGGVLLPMAIFVLYGFWRKDGGVVVEEFTLQNFAMLLDRPVYLWLIVKAVVYAGIVSVATLLLAYPLAYLTATRMRSGKSLMLLAVLVPLYTSDIVRIFAWRSVLGGGGLINQSLIGIGALDQPAPWLLFTPFAALVSLSHMMFPFMFLAVWAGLENLNQSLIESARDLGAKPLTVLRRIVLPLTVPGILAGVFFVFIPVTGDYLYINMMGGTAGVTITKAIVQQFGAADNWPFGSAMATTTMIAMLAVLLAAALMASRLRGLRMIRGG